MEKKEDTDFRKKIDLLSEKIKEQKILITNEETTKTAFIVPFIQMLGYDTTNPLEVQPEFVAAWGEKKDQRVDFAIFKNKLPIIFIEAKSVNEKFVKFDAQLAQYFNAYSDTKFGVLTNGEEYRFFSDTQKENVMDKIPFLVVNFSNLKETDYRNLLKFKKENYDQKSLRNIAEDLHYETAITEKFKDLIKNPSNDFIELLFWSAIPDHKISPKIREKLPSIVKQAIENAFVEMARQWLEDRPKKMDDTPLKKIAQIKTEKNDHPIFQEDSVKFVETTDEELKAFELVKTILSKAGRDITGVLYKDNIDYLSINNRITTKWFLRLFLKESAKSIDVSIDIPDIESLTKGFGIKKYTPAKVTKIFIQSIEDLEKLNNLIIVCFDRVNK
jgi:predicted type IV restriction endonuclease